ncbi:hypothetical protein JRO89_XS02G0210500 [Xanthoceras sorbifolium]|uniref:Retrotransposon gag domain-containing protein n=1 Tax=Xanthoceras sorbifolium TaxID=99658 RepID=A0ABQ8IH42_9ROSI|nr:hypothetical protein JRO89_XS02G0210500 [Xanthoceras sorbifolium]
MTTNKERIENLEAALGGFQDHLCKIEESVTAKLQQLEITLSKTIEALLSKQQPSSSYGTSFTVRSHNTREESRESNESTRALFSSKLTKLEFPKYSRDDPIEWFTRVDQFFEFQGTMESQNVYLASYHLEGEANQWWRWLQCTHKDEGKEVTWEIFVEELWARFGPTDCEDFDEALSKIKQIGSLRDYQKEFERLVGSHSLDTLFVPHTSLWEAIKKEAAGHSYMLRIGKLASEKPDEPYIWCNGLVCYKNRACPAILLAVDAQEKIGKVAYKLKLPNVSRVHPIFHISLLKKYIGDNNISSTELPPIADDGEIIVEPEAILDTRWVKKGKNIIEESLVQWKKLPIEDATWENTQELWDRFSNLNLEDKVPFLERSNDKPRRTTRVSIKNPKYMD